MIKLFIKNNSRSAKGGYTVMELIVYITFFIILSLLVINAMITMTKAFKVTKVEAEWLQGGAIMERIARETRASYAINSISATDLKLNTTDGVGANKTVEFLLSGSNIQFLENNVLTGNLNTPNVAVTVLSFTQITTANGKGVKISLTIKSTNDSLVRTVDYYDTVVLRGVY